EVMDSVMRGLTAAQRALIRMRHEEGLEIAQIAAAIGSTEGAVRVALSRLRRHIMELFKTKTNE
ncbi:MAG: sigma-70 region 4 domain-containing protein, partial [Duncaniella sp.]|nr:sigma-70 region 4 domain-containing protein [Duncaniella sp.]